MNYKYRGTVAFRQKRSMTVTLRCQCPRFLVNGTGKQFVVRRMKGAAGNTLQFLFHHAIHPGKLFIHIPGSAVFRDFQTETVLPGQRMRIGGYCGKVDSFSVHSCLLLSAVCNLYVTTALYFCILLFDYIPIEYDRRRNFTLA